MNTVSEAGRLKKEILIRIVKAFCSDDFEKNVRLIPYDMRPKGCEVPYRCCVYKERAILKDRTIAGLGFSIEDDDEKILLSEYAEKALAREKIDEKVLTVLDAACKGCVPSRIYVTDLCQGCVARHCVNTCKFSAINIVNNKAVIDGTKCKNCKQCISACLYKAITRITVPCEDSCPVDAIEKDENGLAKIDFKKCILCGKCVSVCPFAAVHEKSQLIDVVKNIKAKKKVIAIIAPSIVGQFPGNIYQLKTALIKAGFSDVYEVAQGADITTLNEIQDFNERMTNKQAFMTTSCCAAYNEYVEKHLPELKLYVSATKTPLYYTAEIVKKEHPDVVTVFIGPCSAKRKECLENENIDYMLNFEELGAIFIGKKIEVIECEEAQFMHESSKQGRNFCVSGGVANAIKSVNKNKWDIKPYYINGLDKESIKNLKQIVKNGNCSDRNLIEVMSCQGGCLGGNATINSIPIALKTVNQIANEAKDINDII